MHRIIQAQMNQFVKEHELREEGSADEKFQLFANYCVVSSLYPDRFDPLDVNTTGDDAGIDGVAFVVGDELCTTAEDAKRLLQSSRRGLSVAICFVQAKTSPSFDRGEMLKFGDGVVDFFEDQHRLPHGETLGQARELYDSLVENIGKIRDGRPACKLYYVTTGSWNAERELEATRDNIRTNLERTGLFKEVSVEPIDRDRLIQLWTSSRTPVEARFEALGFLPLPSIRGVEESYLAVVPAKVFVEQVLSDKEGRIQRTVFEQNVRAFLGEDNDVNSRIRNTVTDRTLGDRFPILNNGITIVSPDVRVQGNQFYLADYQIVNGCQTSHVLYGSRNELSPETALTLKVIEANDPEVVSQITKATNSQSQVAPEQFISLSPMVVRLEKYFASFDEESERERRLYFERRERQYAGEGYPEIRIFGILEIARAFTAMFLDLPHVAARYPTQLIVDVRDKIFQQEHPEIAYYTAAFTLYRMLLHFNNRWLSADCRPYKWHLLMILCRQLGGRKRPDLRSKKFPSYCQKILDSVWRPGKASVPDYERAIELVMSVGTVSRDRRKGQPYTTSLIQAINSQLESSE